MRLVLNLKKKYLIIVVIILLAVSVFVGIKVFSNNNNKESKVDLKAPANNTEELLTNSKEIVNANVSKNKIEFNDDINITNGNKIALWLYSTPKFLGWYEVKEENGIKYIDGLEQALNKENVESGSHHLVIVNEDNNTLGYVNIEINEDKVIEEIDAIKELGISQDFYTLGNAYELMHIHFNKDYTFIVDDDKTKIFDDRQNKVINTINFSSGKYELIKQENGITYLTLTFIYGDGTSESVKANISSQKNGDDFPCNTELNIDKTSFSRSFILLFDSADVTNMFLTGR